MDTCPPLEEIAAFLDDMLSPEDRERITAHLASCESCYEVFAGVVQFQEYERFKAATDGDIDQGPFVGNTDETGDPLGEGALLPFAGETDRPGVSRPIATVQEKVRPRAPRWLALAASILLAAASGFFIWRGYFSPAEMVFAGLVQQVEGNTAITEHLYLGETYRSDDAPTYNFAARPTFLTGVHLFDLRLNLQVGGDAETTDRLLQLLGLVLQEVPGMTPTGEFYLKSRPGQLDRDALLRQEEEVRQFLSESPHFQFGLWTEAGRLAALTQSPEFFEDRNNRRFLNYLFKETPWVGDDLLEDVPNHLQTIQEIWDAGELSEEEYGTLATELERIIKAYDTSDDL